MFRLLAEITRIHRGKPPDIDLCLQASQDAPSARNPTVNRTVNTEIRVLEDTRLRIDPVDASCAIRSPSWQRTASAQVLDDSVPTPERFFDLLPHIAIYTECLGAHLYIEALAASEEDAQVGLRQPILVRQKGHGLLRHAKG